MKKKKEQQKKKKKNTEKKWFCETTVTSDKQMTVLRASVCECGIM